MPISDTALFRPDIHSNWIRLRTLVFLRWVAIVGQLAAITVAQRLYGLQIEEALCYLAIGVAIVGNLLAVSLFPENRRLSEFEALCMLLFDLLQLAFLLLLTGGLNNPFSILILAPVTIAATVLPARSTIALGLIAIGLVSALAYFAIPLRMENGFDLEMPRIFIFGFWLAIVIGVLFLGFYARRVTSEMHTMSQALLATQMALAREQKLTDLGGVVAAAAHELGTPLATIKLVSSELIEELDGQDDLVEDARLIRDQTDRCRDILRSMGRAGKDDLHMHQAPLETVVQDAAEPHTQRGKQIDFTIGPRGETEDKQPTVLRRPEIIHGLRNLVQNAVDFAETRVHIDISWTQTTAHIRILDDGHGFPPHLLGRIGEPFMRRRPRATEDRQRPGYEGMGLGLFIAKTLLERSGAELTFSNGSDPALKDAHLRTGAVVEVVWIRTNLEPSQEDVLPFGENQQFEF